MFENVIKKLFPIRDEKNRPCTFPNFGSQVFGDDEEGRALWQAGKGFYADRAANSEKLGGVDASEYAKKTDISNKSGMISDSWKAGTSYRAGACCIYGNALYCCKTEHVSGSEFDAAYWNVTTVLERLTAINGRIDTINAINSYTGARLVGFEIDNNALYIQVVSNGVVSLYNVALNKIA